MMRVLTCLVIVVGLSLAVYQAGCKKKAEEPSAKADEPAEDPPQKKKEELDWSDVQKEFKKLEKERLEVIRLVQDKAGVKKAPPSPETPPPTGQPAPQPTPPDAG